MDVAFQVLSILARIQELVAKGFPPEDLDVASELAGVKGKLESASRQTPWDDAVQRTIAALLGTTEAMEALLPLHREAMELIARIRAVQKRIDDSLEEAQISAHRFERALEAVTVAE